MFKSEDTFQNPLDKNKFVFVSRVDNQPKATEYIGVYDATKDTDYSSTGNVNLDPSKTFTYVYQEDLPNTGADAMIFHPAGMDGNKLVLWETNYDNSPGPCFNTWLDDKGKGATDLTYIDTTATKPVRKPYTVSATQIASATKEMQQCEKDMGL